MWRRVFNLPNLRARLHKLKTCGHEVDSCGDPHPWRRNSFAPGSSAVLLAGYGIIICIRSPVQGMRLEASTSPASQPAIMPTVAAIARTRGNTCAFSAGNCYL